MRVVDLLQFQFVRVNNRVLTLVVVLTVVVVQVRMNDDVNVRGRQAKTGQPLLKGVNLAADGLFTRFGTEWGSSRPYPPEWFSRRPAATSCR